jgi:uncharacterized protein YhfF
MTAEEQDWRALETFSFGDNPELGDDLADLVLCGRKTATCWAAAHGQQTEVGKRMVMLDGQGRPRAIVETVELELKSFLAVDESFAHDEGEGDRSLTRWREAHQDFFSRSVGFDPDMLLWCERFRVVRKIAPSETSDERSASGSSLDT